MKNWFHQVAHIVCIIAALGIGSSFACSQGRIQACSSYVEAYNEKLDELTPEVCSALDNTISCFKRETASCPPQIQGTLNMALKMFEDASKLCKNPDVSVELSDGMESCDHKKLERCVADSQEVPTDQNPETACRALGSTRKCLDDFTAACKSDLLVGMVNSQNDILDKQEKQCISMGYSVGKEVDVASTCDGVAYQKCANDFKNSAAAAQSRAESCRTLGDARKCMDDFKAGCKSEYLVSLVDSQMELIEDTEEECRSDGYSVGESSGGSSSSSSSSQPESRGSTNRIRINNVNNNSNKDESTGGSSSSSSSSQLESGSSTDRTKNNNVNYNSNKDGDGGCGSVQPTLFTLAASCAAILAAYRLFL